MISRPSLDLRNDGSSGGPDGSVIFFAVRNDGQEAARNIKAQFMDGERLIKEQAVPSLTINEQARISYDYTDTLFYFEKLSDPRLVLTYTSVDSRQFVSGAKLLQEQRADGRYNLSTTLGEFFDQALDISVQRNRTKWSTDKMPLGYPGTSSTKELKETVQDLSDEYRTKIQQGKRNKIWEELITNLIKSGRDELTYRAQSKGSRISKPARSSWSRPEVIIAIIAAIIATASIPWWPRIFPFLKSDQPPTPFINNGIIQTGANSSAAQAQVVGNGAAK